MPIIGEMNLRIGGRRRDLSRRAEVEEQSHQNQSRGTADYLQQEPERRRDEVGRNGCQHDGKGGGEEADDSYQCDDWD